MATRTAKRNGSTRKWRETRARMLRTLPARCGICGQWITHPGTCDVDHILPVEHGGTDHPSNLRLTHASCNRGRRVKRVSRAVVEAPVAKPADALDWRKSYPPNWPPDPDPAGTVVTWSRHWWGAGQFNPRCPHCRELGRACTDTAA